MSASPAAAAAPAAPAAASPDVVSAACGQIEVVRGALNALNGLLAPLVPGSSSSDDDHATQSPSTSWTDISIVDVQHAFQHVVAQLDPIEAAKLHAAFAYTLSTLFFVYLRTKGESPDVHPVKQELDRIKQYLTKISTTVQTLNERASKKRSNTDADQSSSSSLSAPAPRSVDKPAAKRLIAHALAGQNTTAQSAASTTTSAPAKSTTSKNDAKQHSASSQRGGNNKRAKTHRR